MIKAFSYRHGNTFKNLALFVVVFPGFRMMGCYEWNKFCFRACNLDGSVDPRYPEYKRTPLDLVRYVFLTKTKKPFKLLSIIGCTFVGNGISLLELSNRGICLSYFISRNSFARSKCSPILKFHFLPQDIIWAGNPRVCLGKDSMVTLHLSVVFGGQRELSLVQHTSARRLPSRSRRIPICPRTTLSTSLRLSGCFVPVALLASAGSPRSITLPMFLAARQGRYALGRKSQ